MTSNRIKKIFLFVIISIVIEYFPPKSQLYENNSYLTEIVTEVIYIHIAKILERQAGLANNCYDQKAFKIISLIFQVTQMLGYLFVGLLFLTLMTHYSTFP